MGAPVNAPDPVTDVFASLSEFIPLLEKQEDVNGCLPDGERAQTNVNMVMPGMCVNL
jgi:hypothetical protein